MPSYKEGVSNFDKHSTTYLNIIHQRPIKFPIKYRHLFVK